MKVVNLLVKPPFFWINQWAPFLCCCWNHSFDIISVRYSRDNDGGLNVTVSLVVLGFGFCWSWYDRIDRARFLAEMDQITEHAKDFLRQETGRPELFQEDDDG